MTDSRAAAPEPTPAPKAALKPVEPAARMIELDMLRGWAVLGILAVNAISFAWPAALMFDLGAAPFAVDWGGAAATADKVGQWVVDVFFANKMRTLFSLLFGVSIFLVGGEREDEDRGALLKRRLWWLLLIGLVHGAAFWFGDILLHYAICGFIVMTMRSWPAKKLIWIGGGVTAAWAVIGAGLAWMGAVMGGQSGMEGNPFVPTPESVMATVEIYRSGWAGAAVQNLIMWAIVQGFSLLLIAATTPLMLLGMGLYKTGFLTGRAPVGLLLLLIGLGGATLAFAAWAEWNALGAPTEALQTQALAEVAGAFAPLAMLGYVAALLLLSRGLKGLARIFAPVGQMAFTNYLSQTLIMTTIFYMPWGPQLFGQVGPAGLWIAVAGIWVAQLIWSPLWLSRFRMGPLEWLWRCLTYRRRVPILR